MSLSDEQREESQLIADRNAQSATAAAIQASAAAARAVKAASEADLAAGRAVGIAEGMRLR